MSREYFQIRQPLADEVEMWGEENKEPSESLDKVISDLKATNELVGRNTLLRASYVLTSLARVRNPDFIKGEQSFSTFLQRNTDIIEKRTPLLELLIRHEDKQIFSLSPDNSVKSILRFRI